MKLNIRHFSLDGAYTEDNEPASVSKSEEVGNSLTLMIYDEDHRCILTVALSSNSRKMFIRANEDWGIDYA